MPLRGRGGRGKKGRQTTYFNGTAPGVPTITGISDVGTNRPYNNGAVTVSFRQRWEDDYSTPASSFIATASSGHTATGSSSPLTITGIPAGTSVTVTVKAVNQFGESASSSASSAVTATTVPQAPSAPSVSSPTPSAGVNQAGTTTDSVSWSAPANNGGKSITNYQWSSSDGKGNTTTGTSVSVNQEGGTSQTYQVRAYNDNGWSEYSANSSNITTFSFSPFSVFGFSPFNVFGFSPTPPFSVFGFSPFNVFGFSPFNVFGFSPTPPFSVFGFSPTAFSVFGFSPINPTYGGKNSVFGDTKLRTPNGLILARDVKIGDQLSSVVLPGLPESGWTPEDILAWTASSVDINDNDLVVTTVVDVITRNTNKIIFINGDAFSESHAILVNRDNVISMKFATEILDTDLVWLYTTGWTPINALDVYEVEHTVYSINTEPYDVFFTENMLVHDSRPNMS